MNSFKKNTYVLLVAMLCTASAFAGYAFVSGPKEKTFAYSPGDYFITNIADSKSLLKSGMVIEVTDKKHFIELTRNSHKARDIIIGILRSKTYSEIKSPDIQLVLKEQIKEGISKTLNGITVSDIYFNEFVVQ
ncbi:MAG: flagellar basal body-associated FliL family protein [Firmicutes bacterium]|nr:flagellar basal body-associated FliL family protein [Bacillota bacterium]